MTEGRRVEENVGLTGKVALVTGGGSAGDGIGNGRAAAILLARAESGWWWWTASASLPTGQWK